MALSAAYFNPYIRDLFLTAIPAWAANAMTPGVLVNSVPQQLDLVRSATLHLSAVIYQNVTLDTLDSRIWAGAADGGGHPPRIGCADLTPLRGPSRAWRFACSPSLPPHAFSTRPRAWLGVDRQDDLVVRPDAARHHHGEHRGQGR
jgi:hypothetical protein